MKMYAGIGSRQTPPDVLRLMEVSAILLWAQGWTLHSGGASGADSAFEDGVPAQVRQDCCRIFLPGNNFNGRSAGRNGCIDSTKLEAWPRAVEIAKHYHPAPSKLSGFGLKLMARNCFQVLGPNLDELVKFVMCWTPGGAMTGGTSQALRIAVDHGIQVRNLGDPAVHQAAKQWALDAGRELLQSV